MIFVLVTISSVCLKAAMKSRKLNKCNEKAVVMQEIIIESLKQSAVATQEKPKIDPFL